MLIDYKIKYRIDYEPSDIDTLITMMKYHSPALPTFIIDDFEEDVDVNVRVSDVPTAVDKKDSMIYLRVENKVYRFKLFHAEPVTKIRYGYRMQSLIKINEDQYLDVVGRVGIDFGLGKASERLYFKLAGQNIKIAVEYGLI